MHHPPNPDPVPLRQEPYLLPPPPRPQGQPYRVPTVRTDRMPLPLRFLRVLCVLYATLTLFAVPVAVLLLLSLDSSPHMTAEWYAEWGMAVPRLWFWVVVCPLLAVLYFRAAARLGRGGRSARGAVLTALALDTVRVLIDTTVLTATDPLVDHWVTAVVAWIVGLVVNLVLPGFFLVLLWVLRSSRDWLRATDTRV
ncbi:hypothetical protein [Nocardiopsis lucentensis]|uniref:hypothetical protein n=1 Tax=Nocardiopsis lucentensis TaxID=53441 RepID=UPI00034CB742|nr:hypothetical protein [Nocardiopsis lucentensis]